MFTTPQDGWTHIQLENFSERASYLTDIPNDCLDAFIHALQTNNPAIMYFDAEGFDYHLISSFYRSYIIKDKEDNKVDIHVIEKDILELAKELVNDIQRDFDKWLNWESYDDGEYAEVNREVFREKLSLLNFEINKRK